MKIPRTKRYSIYKKLVLIEEQRRLTKDKKLFFEPDDREHYIYRVTDYTRTEKEHYYGSHTPEKGKKYDSLVEEFWEYETSSKYNVLNKDKKEDYKVKILKVFDNPADKMIYEAFLHQYFDVKSHNKFWNESNQTPFGFDTTSVKYSEEMLMSRKNSYEKINEFGFDSNTKIMITNIISSDRYYCLHLKGGITENHSRSFVRSLSGKLPMTTEEFPLGRNKSGRSLLKKNGKAFLIGAYVTKLDIDKINKYKIIAKDLGLEINSIKNYLIKKDKLDNLSTKEKRHLSFSIDREFYKLFNGSEVRLISKRECKAIHYNLINTSKEDPITKKGELNGCYVERVLIKDKEKKVDLILDYIERIRKKDKNE